MSDLRREILRKAFHLLSLVYLAAFHLIGWPSVVWAMAGWLAFVLVVETARLEIPAVGRALAACFSGMIRETERRHYSGIFHITAGSLAAMLIAGGDAVIVGAAILQLALGDAAGALVGKAFGRVKILGSLKSIEGTAAIFSVGFASAIACGVRPGAALAAAGAGALAELLPTTGRLNDNFWIPVAAAAVLRLSGS